MPNIYGVQTILFSKPGGPGIARESVSCERMIVIEHLTKSFGPIMAVNDLSLEVTKGEVLGFLGPNGAGKSTTMKMIVGFLRPTSGSISVAGIDVEESPVEVQRKIGYLPEGAPLYGEMTPQALLDFVCNVRGIKGARRITCLERAIRETGLSEVLHQRIDTLSKGFKRRVGLAQAIIHDPDILILDEPTDGLDPNQKQYVRNLIRGMASSKAIIISTHILEEVDAVCTRAIIIDQGRIVADATPGEFEAMAPEHHAVELMLDEPLTADATRELLALDGISGITSVSELKYRVLPEKGQSILLALSRKLHELDLNVTELKELEGRLDDVFRSITTSDGQNSAGDRINA